jgi:hypothetical protein
VGKWKVAQGDCLAVLKTAPDNFFDAMVCDPPAGVSFMGREWDSDKGGRDQWVAWLKEVMAEAKRTLKPGAHCLVWALPRTSHWTATALEDAGMEIRDVVNHVFGSGFPKSADISKAIDKMAGAEREVLATIPDRWAGKGTTYERANEAPKESVNITAPATPEAKTWDGWGTALKPATEHWILCRKPLAASSIARNVLTHGTGALNIDGCRVGDELIQTRGAKSANQMVYGGGKGLNAEDYRGDTHEGRWPPNLLLSDEAIDLMEEQAPGVSRFFPTFRYQAKPARGEKEAGLDALPEKPPAFGADKGDGLGRGISNTRQDWLIKNTHPTVKSIELMRWLCRLITPPGGAVLDPFAGSGSTGVGALLEGFDFFGIEQDPHYVEICRARLAHWAAQK